MKDGDTMDGVLLIHKEKNMTSHDVVYKLRKILHTKKIGHSGTLDPNATGVLLVMIGKATKILPFLEDTDKEYIAEMILGKKTISDDIWGEEIARAPIVKILDFQGVLNTFLGKQKQLPPMVSSVRVNGRKLYEYARAHEEVERPLRNVEVYEIEALDKETLKFRVSCSSGTYIRSLIYDIAAKSKNVGCMSSLVRTKVGKFDLSQSVSVQDVLEGRYTLLPIEEMLSHLPSVQYTPIEDVYHGKKIRIQCKHEQILLTDKGSAIAIYKRDHEDVFRSIRGLW